MRVRDDAGAPAHVDGALGRATALCLHAMTGSTDTLRVLFEAALALPADQRAAFLEGECSDAALRARIDAMLRADAGGDEPVSSDRLARLAQAIGEDVLPGAFPPGCRVGPFEIVRAIGEGGSSTVFEAVREFDGATQRVALKLLRNGLLGADARRRFAREQRALLRLQHPNIAHMLEGGVTAHGVAYIALELVEGRPITRYADEQALGPRARLALFATVCRAVDAAHRALIVHRDLKPSNVLVTDGGQAKLLDFGIAKLLADEADPEATMLQAFTPAYAAPEQASGGAITTATDVYALGIMLGELLTGRRAGGPAIATADAGTPSTTTRRLRNDIDAVVAKATEPEPDRRYASAGALADDIDRLLEQRPVQAQPQTRWYRARKFILRHRGGVAGTMAFVLAILAALCIALWQARATHVEAVRANAVRDLLMEVFRTAEQSQPKGSRASPEDIVESGMRRVLGDTVLPDESRLEFIGVLATVASTTGAYVQMDHLTGEAVRIADRLYRPGDLRWIDTRRQRAQAMIHLNRADEAVKLLRPWREELLAIDQRAAYEALLVLGVALDKAGADGEDGKESTSLLKALRERAERSPVLPPDVVLHVMISEADQLASKHHFRESLERASAAEKYWRDRELPLTGEVLWLYEAIGNSASSLGDAERGEAAYRNAITLSERLHDRPHSDTAWFIGLLGSYLVSLGRVAEAEPYVVKGLEMRRETAGPNALETLFAVGALARLRALQQRQGEAIALLDEAIAGCTRADPGEACVTLLQTRGRMHGKASRFGQAEADLEAALTMQIGLSGEGSARIASQYAYLAEVQRRKGSFAEALASSEKALQLIERHGGAHFGTVGTARLQHAWSNLELGDARAAFDEISIAEPKFAEASPQNVNTRIAMKAVAAAALSRLGRAPEAAAYAREARQLAAPAGIDAESKALLDTVAGGE